MDSTQMFIDQEWPHFVRAGDQQYGYRTTQDHNWQPLENAYTIHEAQIYSSNPPNSISSPGRTDIFMSDLDVTFSQHSQYNWYNSSDDSRSSTPSQGSGISHYGAPGVESNAQIRYAAEAASIHNVQAQHNLEIFPNKTIWQPAPQTTLFSYDTQTASSYTISAQSTLTLKAEVDCSRDEVFEHDIAYEEDDTIVFSQTSPRARLQPEEIELSDVSAISPPSSTTTANERGWESPSHSDDDRIENDRESDSDYTAKSPRRKRTNSIANRGVRSPRHRGKSSSHAVQDDSARVHKRRASTTSKRALKPKKPFASRTSIPIDKSQRSFPCAFHHFGCPLEFPNKNEWKRHVACQHLQLGFFRCDMDDCHPDNVSTIPRARNHFKHEDENIKVFNDFNRKDLFTQHCRRMHGPSRNPALCSTPPSRKGGELKPTKEDEAQFERQLTSIRSRCWQVRRKAPSRSNCGICHQVFDAEYVDIKTRGTQGPEEKAWEERMEHLGRHYEKEALTKTDEAFDDDLAEWGLRTGVFRKLEDGRHWLMNAGEPDDGPEAVSTSHLDHRQKARRQSGRTVVRRRLSIKQEQVSGDEDAIAEDD